MIRALVSMMAAAAVCVAAMPLGGCATDAISYSKARTAAVKADSALERIRKQAEKVLPFLPPATAERVRQGLEIADGAMGAARGAVDEDDRTLQLGRAVGAVAAIVAALKGN